MLVVLALVLLATSMAAHLGALFGSRWAAQRLFSVEKRRSVPAGLARGVAGPVGWYLAGGVLVAASLVGSAEPVVDLASMRVLVARSSPAERAGVRDGDQIVWVAGERVTSWDQLRSTVTSHGDETLSIEILRGSEMVTLSAVPEGSPRRIGVGPWTEDRRVSLGQAVTRGFVWPAAISGAVAPSKQKGLGEETEVTGPIGLVQGTAAIASGSGREALWTVSAWMSCMLPLVVLGSLLFEVGFILAAFGAKKTARIS